MVGCGAALAALAKLHAAAPRVNYYTMSEMTARPTSRPSGALTARILGRIGRFFISAGLVALAFVAYQLWGTGILQAQAQGGLAEDFRELTEQLELVETPPVPTPTAVAVPDAPPTALLTASPTPATFVPVAAVEREVGQVVGRLMIPRIDLGQFVVEGVGAEELQKGPGHYVGTPMPGMAGNVGLAGHRTTWGAPFHRIDELRPGDPITLEMPWGEATYEVIGHTGDDGSERGYFIVDPTDVWVLDQEGENRLTLTSCHPKYSARQRIIVTARLISEPVQLDEPRAEVTSAPLELATESLPKPDVGATRSGSLGAGAADSTRADGVAAEADRPADAAAFAEPGEVPSFGEGLSGDRSAIVPAVAWGLAAVALWWTTAYVARRWRPLVCYSAAIAPLVVVWFVAFSHIDQAIPSY